MTEKAEVELSEEQLIAKAVAYATGKHMFKMQDILAVDIKKTYPPVTTLRVHIYLRGSPIKAVVHITPTGEVKSSHIEELVLT